MPRRTKETRLWKGSLAFGAVDIPVSLSSGSRDRSIPLQYLHKKDLQPVRYVRVCSADGKEVPYRDLVRGYQYEKGRYVVLTARDLKRASVKRDGKIDLLQFAERNEIPAHLLEKPYFLHPEKGGERAYALLHYTLERAGRAAIARFVLHGREHFGTIVPEHGFLLLNQLRFETDMAYPKTTSIASAFSSRFSNRELLLAAKLVERLTAPFASEHFRDSYYDQLQEVISDRALHTLSPGTLKSHPKQIKDLMESLKKSLEEREREAA